MTDAINDGGEYDPAFPVNTANLGDVGALQAHPGMTLRDWFAGQALTGLASHTDNGMSQWCGSEHVAAEYAYRFADAMLAAREARQ